MKPVFFIAKRYLFAKKSHNVINIISIISAAGIAIGCAALVIILSIYNGFDSLVKSLYESHSSDIEIVESSGNAFSPQGGAFDEIKNDPAVISFCEALEQNVFLRYGNSQTVATAIGVDSAYTVVTGLAGYLIEGDFRLQDNQIKEAVVGRSLASDLGISTAFVTPLELYFPSRNSEVSLLNPMASLKSEKVFPSGIVALDQNFDRKYIFVPIATLRSLLEYDNQVTSVEIAIDPKYVTSDRGVSSQVQKRFEKALGENFRVKNRFQQNESFYKLLTYEKLAIYIILLFIVLIISCNVFGSLSMLVIEKKDDMEIFRSMGAPESMVKKIFITEGWMISLLGMAVGVVFGLLLCWAQHSFGLVQMPGNFIIKAYPVVVKMSDIVVIVASVALIGYLMAHLPFMRKR